MKYKLTDNTKIHNGDTLYRIEALKDFGNVKKGDLGGFVQTENNLYQTGDCWIYDDAIARDASRVRHNAQLRDNAIAMDYVWITESVVVTGYTEVGGRRPVTDAVTQGIIHNATPPVNFEEG